MDDDRSIEDREKPATSKKKLSKTPSGKEDGYRDRQDNDSDISQSLQLTSSSLDSVSFDVGRKLNIRKAETGKMHSQKDNKPKRLLGRVEKRKRRPSHRRSKTKSKRKTKEQKKEQGDSVSTLFTRSDDSSRIQYCCICREKICRYYENLKRKNQKKLNKNTAVKISEREQVGSRSNVLSPLLVTSNSAPAEDINLPHMERIEITPEMIHESLRHLTMWKQSIPTSDLMDYLIRNYPVNEDKEALLKELLEKLEVAVITGLVSRDSEDTWSLNSAHKNRKLVSNHVTTFWKLYADTLTPIGRRKVENRQNVLSSDRTSQAEISKNFFDYIM